MSLSSLSIIVSRFHPNYEPSGSLRKDLKICERFYGTRTAIISSHADKTSCVFTIELLDTKKIPKRRLEKCRDKRGMNKANKIL